VSELGLAKKAFSSTKSSNHARSNVPLVWPAWLSAHWPSGWLAGWLAGRHGRCEQTLFRLLEAAAAFVNPRVIRPAVLLFGLQGCSGGGGILCTHSPSGPSSSSSSEPGQRSRILPVEAAAASAAAAAVDEGAANSCRLGWKAAQPESYPSLAPCGRKEGRCPQTPTPTPTDSHNS
jgi:hypothetical protein